MAGKEAVPSITGVRCDLEGHSKLDWREIGTEAATCWAYSSERDRRRMTRDPLERSKWKEKVSLKKAWRGAFVSRFQTFALSVTRGEWVALPQRIFMEVHRERKDFYWLCVAPPNSLILNLNQIEPGIFLKMRRSSLLAFFQWRTEATWLLFNPKREREFA